MTTPVRLESSTTARGDAPPNSWKWAARPHARRGPNPEIPAIRDGRDCSRISPGFIGSFAGNDVVHRNGGVRLPAREHPAHRGRRPAPMRVQLIRAGHTFASDQSGESETRQCERQSRPRPNDRAALAKEDRCQHESKHPHRQHQVSCPRPRPTHGWMGQQERERERGCNPNQTRQPLLPSGTASGDPPNQDQ